MGSEIPLGLPEHLSEQEMTPSPVDRDGFNHKFHGLYCRVEVEALNDCAMLTPSL